VLVGLAGLLGGSAWGQSSILASIPDPAKASELRSRPAETMAAAAVNPKGRAPRTSWGHPSIEGVYTTDDLRRVPLSRPDELGMRQSLTQAELLARASQDQGAHHESGNVESLLLHEYGIRTFG